MIVVFLASILLGAVGGLMAGLFGIGGGLIIVPVLAMLFAAKGFPEELVMIMSVATSLATIVLTSIFSVLAHHRLGSVLWDKVLAMGPGIMAGAALGAVVADYIAGDVLRVIFIIYLLAMGVQMALQLKPKPGQQQPSKALDLGVSCLMGLLSSLLGIGGGTLIVPFLVHFQTPMRNAVAIASACGLPISVVGTIGYALLGRDMVQLPDWSLGYIYIPSFIGIVLTSTFTAPIGAKLAHRLPSEKLKRYFSLLLFVMAAKLIWF
ncbi:sulfite exporter TauE/SafE family protein [Candidatus Methylobacter oryzae]|uniref:Probable membrane transporter protein n=1 Tax=Candidatus Methylobacter oryzae TaxID=2497749 RepID=A0ABY3CDX0_9GAMM|nr:sulfite exporter TauE/SafE family protein [Candidatus Methylobacter oryzae]TRW99045.1 sulfite exporter TauE/SafE family protein [Candidatus Methylobacter oryzae]